MANYYYSEQATGSIPFKTNDYFYVDDESVSAASLTAQINLVAPALTFSAKTLTLSGFNGQSIAVNNFIFADGSKIIISDGTVGTTDGANTIISGIGDDYIDGGVNIDTVSYATATSAITATASSNSLSVNNSTPSISLGGGGADHLYNIENLIGSVFSDMLIGSNLIDNILDGGLGIDTLYGGSGNDTYIVTPGDTIIEFSGNGVTDTVKSAYDFILPANVENLVLTGISIYGIGNNAGTLGNTITGNSANNILDGVANTAVAPLIAAVDTLIGGTGNDTYLLRNANDIVTEALNAGTDTIITSVAIVSNTLAANVENIVLNSGLTVTGNALNNIIYSSTATDFLNGGVGTDTISYKYATSGVIANLGALSNTTISSGGGGADQIAGGTFEILEGGRYSDNLTDTTASANTLIGGDGNDTIISTGGRDFLDGGNGNDIYSVASLDPIYFKDTAGIDTVRTSAINTSSIAQTTFLENLTLTGATGTGIGNMANNILSSEGGAHNLDGGNGNDILNGLSGNDTLIGGAGNDTLFGGDGTDIIIAGDGIDFIDGGISNDVINLTDSKIESDIIVINRSTSYDSIIGFEIADQDMLYFDINGLGLNAADHSINTLTGIGTVIPISAAQAAELTLGAWDNHIIVDTAAAILALNLSSNINGDPRSGTVLAVASDTGSIYLDANGNFTNAGTLPVLIGSLNTPAALTSDNLAIIKYGITIKGDGYANYLYGSSGNDTIIAGGGADSIYGSGGTDTFVLGSNSAAADVISDFTAALDILDLDAYTGSLTKVYEEVATVTANITSNANVIIFGGVTSISAAAIAIAADATITGTTGVIVFSNGTNTFVYGTDNLATDGNEVLLATLTGIINPLLFDTGEFLV